MVVITLGTGFGSAFLNRGVPVVSGSLVPKEGCLWHLPFLDGVADDYFSTRWFTGEYRNRTGKSISGVEDLLQQKGQEALVAGLFDRFGRNLALCLAPWLELFGAEILIIGGNIARALPLFGGELREGLRKAGSSIPVLPSRLMETAALLGSARLLDNSFWQSAAVQLPGI